MLQRLRAPPHHLTSYNLSSTLRARPHHSK